MKGNSFSGSVRSFKARGVNPGSCTCVEPRKVRYLVEEPV